MRRRGRVRFGGLLPLLSLLASSAFLGACGSREGGIEVTFRMHSPDLAPEQAVYLSGSAEALGRWRADAVSMTHVGDRVWEASVRFPAPLSVEYKYTLGSWEREGAQPTGFPLPNFAARLDDGTVVDDAVLFWTSGPREFEVQGQVTGQVEYLRGMAGEGVLPRDLIVWLPPGYEAEPERRYPVLYLHDGQNVIDPATSSFGVDWAVDESLDRLIRDGKLEPLIVVGLSSTENRTAEYSPGPAGAAYMAFLVERVKPMIDARYRTLPGKGHTLVGGSSMGGLVSCMLGWAYPEVFGAVLCFSPAFAIEGREDWSAFFTASERERRDVFFYLDNGGIGLEEELQPGIDRMLAFLEGRGYERGEDFVFVLDPDARHFEAAWAERFPGAIVTAFERIRGR